MKYRIPGRLAHVVVDHGQSDPAMLFLMQLPDGPPLVLHDSAALIWIIAAEGNPDVAARVAETVERPLAEVAGEVADYLAELVGRGLLAVSQTPTSGPR